MRDGQPGGGSDVFAGHPQPAVPRGMGGGSPGRHDVGTHTVDLEGGTDFGDLVERFIGQFDLAEQVLGGADAIGEFCLGFAILRGESFGIVVEGDTALDDLDAQSWIARRGDLDGEAEAVEELRAEFAFFGVHRADEDEFGGVGDRDAVTFDGRAAHRGRIQQKVDEVVVQEVDLVDIQDAAVGAGEESGLILGDAFGERLLEVERAEYAVLGGADGELDEANRPGFDRGAYGERSIGGERIAFARIAGEPIARDDVDRRQHVSERAHHRGLGRTLFAADENAADRRRNRGQREGERHVIGTDDGAERKMIWHVGLPLCAS